MNTRFKKSVYVYIYKGKQVKIVHQYKYLSTILDDRLDWSVNPESLLKKEMESANTLYEETEIFERLPQTTGTVLLRSCFLLRASF